MPLLSRRDHKKKDPFRDATLFIIVCEGSNREPEYFEYFDRLSARIKVKAVANIDGKSSPKHMVNNASVTVDQIVLDGGDYSLWIVIDTDHWIKQGHIPQLKKSCDEQNWNLAISNPCFEVWLNFHLSSRQPEKSIELCKTWKTFLDKHDTEFSHETLPALIETAIINSKKHFQQKGFLPEPGSTQVFKLAQQIWPLVEKVLK
ncbi:MAG: RloB family protein [Bacteroidota bacterium]